MNKNTIKLGILTFHCADNYGAVLQAYALQNKLAELGTECEVIDYQCPYIVMGYRIFKKKVFQTPKSILRFFLNFIYLLMRKWKFVRFRKKYLHLSSRISDTKSLEQVAKKYDIIIAGSDQIWNEQKSKSIKAYMLDWVNQPEKKSAYAASFGYDKIPEEFLPNLYEYAKLLYQFSHISVREEQAANIVRNLIKMKPPVVLDPIMLFSKSDWINIFKTNINHPEEYILLYTFEPGNTLRFAEHLKKLTGLPIIYINSNLKRRINAKYIRSCSPQEFVSLLLEARYVITNSFHGTAFSVIFNKDFFVDLLPNNNSRLEHILNMFGLSDRIIKDEYNENVMMPIDYHVVNQKIEELRAESLKYLKLIIGKSDE
jgi:hypothetical protein